ncbi:MAG: methylenetetrahydrofolate reductase, partial [Bacteroidales bacterium]
VRQVGVEWAVNQVRELIQAGVPLIHFFTMGRTDNIQKIAASIL